jgi:hypothetical protein
MPRFFWSRTRTAACAVGFLCLTSFAVLNSDELGRVRTSGVIALCLVLAYGSACAVIVAREDRLHVLGVRKVRRIPWESVLGVEHDGRRIVISYADPYGNQHRYASQLYRKVGGLPWDPSERRQRVADALDAERIRHRGRGGEVSVRWSLTTLAVLLLAAIPVALAATSG